MVTVDYENTHGLTGSDSVAFVSLDNVEKDRILHKGRNTVSLPFTHGNVLKIGEVT